ncbi:thiol-activated cytolysin family protein [Deinococcus roseus]|uniref:PLL-like beta propeller domain-containing protein n=1 Tax=Deinococcus roseus TaxID=392414 RepID=A0ABQ2D0J3_9DEIO|nr:thiol-activated cytolysin family protein [Deinococcus roseus]GGJ39106.1 hypothetical protein GCM10008938_26390 [Deinococcus roseus]
MKGLLAGVLLFFGMGQAQQMESLGGVITSKPGCVSANAGQLDCFARGGDGALWQKSWTGTAWSDWVSRGGQFQDEPECVSWGVGRIDCFVKGNDQGLHHIWKEGNTWGTWESLAGQLAERPECLSTRPGEVSCIVKATNSSVYQKSWTGNRWTDWVPLSGTVLDVPECVSWGAGRIDCFARGTNSAQHHIYTPALDRWSGWEPLGGGLHSRSSCVTEGVNRISCFVRGGDRALYVQSWTGQRFTGWDRLDGALTSAPDCLRGFSGQTDCFFAADGGVMNRLTFTDQNHKSSLKTQSGALQGSPECVSWGAGRIDCFARGTSNDLLHWWYAENLDSTQMQKATLAVGQYPRDAKTPDAFFQALHEGPALQVVRAAGPSGLKEKGQSQETQQAPDGNYLCQVRQVSFSNTPEEFVTFEGAMGNLWLGNLAQGEGLKGGSFKGLSVPANQRQPLTLYLGGLNFAGNRETVNATASEVSTGIGNLLSRFKSTGLQAGAGTVFSKVTVSESLESSLIQAGFNASYLTASVKGSLEKRSSQKRNKVTGFFIQKVFQVALDTQGQTPASALFGTLTPISTLESLGASKELSYSNLPAYVSSIAYGRMVAVSMESNYTEDQMTAALEASYSGLFASATGRFKTDLKEVLQESSIEVKVLGGDEESAKRLIRSGQFADYFGVQSTPIETFRPISYTLRYIGNNDVAAVNKTTDFEIKECSASSVRLKPQFRFTLVVPDDKNYDDLYGSITVNGKSIYEVEENRNSPVYPMQTVQLGALPDLNVNFDQDQFIRINGLLMDHDSGPNDRVGHWDLNFNLREAANAYRAGQAFFEKTFRAYGEDDSIVDLTLRFDFR